MAIDPVDAHPPGQGSIDIQGFGSDSPLLFLSLKTQSPHVMEPVRQFDKYHANIRRHGENHFANIFGLALFGTLEMDFADFGDAVYNIGGLFTKKLGYFLQVRMGVFNDVMQQPGGNANDVHFQLGQDIGGFQGMGKIGFPRETNLSLVDFGRIHIGLFDRSD